MDHSSEDYRTAIAFIKSGDKPAGRRILLRLLRQDPADEMAWLWLIETLETDSQRMEALQHCLKYNPESQRAQKALQSLQNRGGSTAVSEVAGESSSTDMEPYEPLLSKTWVRVLLAALFVIIILGGLALVWFAYLLPSGMATKLFSPPAALTQAAVVESPTSSPTATATHTFLPTQTLTPTLTPTPTITPLPVLSLSMFPSLQFAYLKADDLYWMDNSGGVEKSLEGVRDPLLSADGRLLYTDLQDEDGMRWTIGQDGEPALAVFNPAQLVTLPDKTWADCSQNYAESWQPGNFIAVQCGYTANDTYDLLAVSYDAATGEQRCRSVFSLLKPAPGFFSPDGRFLATMNGERLLVINMETCLPQDELDPLSPLTSSGFLPTDNVVYLNPVENMLYRYVESVFNKKKAVLKMTLADNGREVITPATEDFTSVFNPEDCVQLEIVNAYYWMPDTLFMNLVDSQTGDLSLSAVPLQEGGLVGWVDLPADSRIPDGTAPILSPDGKVILVYTAEEMLAALSWQNPAATPKMLADGVEDILAWSADSNLILLKDSTSLLTVDLAGMVTRLAENPGDLAQPVVWVGNGGFFYQGMSAGDPRAYVVKAGWQPLWLEALSGNDIDWVQPVLLP